MALNGKTAVVTGAAMGIGRSIAELLLQNGAKVAILDMNEAAGQSLVETLNKETVIPVVSQAAFQKTVETFGGIDILVNNAGIFNEIMWEKTIGINLAGCIRGAYLVIEHMNKLTGGRGGVIVNVASIAGKKKTVFTNTMATNIMATGIPPSACCNKGMHRGMDWHHTLKRMVLKN
uniref:15-hydroxyprostaglandin dehydrogenase n=1 Tax=Oreochromis niloticus TaxID=8128 RepID=A0A669E089_ORENI